LKPSALVLFADQLPYDWINRRRDEEGNLVEERIVANRVKFEIVKNFPTEEEVTRELDDLAQEVSYQQYPERGYWTVSYKTRRSRIRGLADRSPDPGRELRQYRSPRAASTAAQEN
jgi:hypothetical protein